MSTRQRNRTGARARKGSMKSVATFILLAVISFGLGFFVLASLIPGAKAPATSAQETAASNAQPIAAPSATPVAPVVTPVVPVAPVAPIKRPAAHPAPGPSIDPMDGGAPSSGQEYPTQQSATPDPGAVQAPAAPDAGATAAPTAIAAPHRRRTRGGANAPAPAAPDTTTPAPASTDATTQRPVPGNTLYRVQLGVFGNKAVADQHAQAAKDKGFAIFVHAVTRKDGQTVYRVQRGVFKDPAHAEEERQNLNNAGFPDAAVVKQ